MGTMPIHSIKNKELVHEYLSQTECISHIRTVLTMEPTKSSDVRYRILIHLIKANCGTHVYITFALHDLTRYAHVQTKVSRLIYLQA